MHRHRSGRRTSGERKGGKRSLAIVENFTADSYIYSGPVCVSVVVCWGGWKSTVGGTAFVLQHGF